MLIRLAVENFLCFGERACLDLGTPPPVTFIVGENGAGKSSLLKALACVRNLALGGSRPGQPLPITPNALLPARPTRIELTVQHEGALWTYGFAATRQQIEEEWLTRNSNGEPRPLFTRRRQAGKSAAAIELTGFGAEERQRLELVAYGTRPEQLFLNEGLRRGVPGLTPLGVWLRDRLQMILPDAKIVGLSARAAREPGFAAFLGALLARADTGVADVTARREPVGEDMFETEEEKRELVEALTRFPDAFAETPDGELIAEQTGRLVDIYRVQLVFTLADAQGRRAELPVSGLSDGMLRLLHLAPLLYRAPGQGPGSAPVFFLDDLTRGLHPRQVRELVQRFTAAASSDGAQLIATAHDTSALGVELLPRQQTFVMERAAGGVAIRDA